MNFISNFPQSIATIDESNFEEVALGVFRYQFETNPLYKQYVRSLGKSPDLVKEIGDIPFLPIEFFKEHEVKSGEWIPQAVFTSSGTTGSVTSRHLVRKVEDYTFIARYSFEYFYGSPDNFLILALLPSYMERKGSSLIQMVNDFVGTNPHTDSGFFLNERKGLLERLDKHAGEKVLLLGVTFALLDMAENNPSLNLEGTIVMETGGMKGRRREMTRLEVHNQVKQACKVPVIHSEYGMTELMSQAYSKGNGQFECPPWMHVLTREINDPLSLRRDEKTGVINVIDLGNLHTCSFIATSDMGKVDATGRFEVLGRLDNSDIRGCNLMIT